MNRTANSERSAVAVRAMPLAAAQEGETVRIIRFRGQGQEVKAMIAAGMNVGRVCPVFGKLPGGGVLVGIDDRRLAVGSSAASEIWVRLVDE
ncbi:MAG: FeoA family protein [Rhodospirillales bacterium]|jgi:Fe2+ transport system protein FeoA